MSLYEPALEEWKKRDPHLLDFEGCQRFLDAKRVIAEHREDNWRQRNNYCIQKLRNRVVTHQLIREFGDITEKPINNWQDFYEMAHRYTEIVKGLGDFLPFGDWFSRDKIKKTLGIMIGIRFAYDTWRRIVKHPEWFADWDCAYGYKGYTGSRYKLGMWLALCVKLGLEQRASEILNNLPEELRHPPEPPEHIKEGVEKKVWKKTYKEYCKDCKRPTCESCVPYIPDLNLCEK